MSAHSDTPPRLVLGTAQLGMAYGIANREGMPDDARAARLLRQARALGYDVFDTARAYGESERRLGLSLGHDAGARLLTKLAPLDALLPETPRHDVEHEVRASLAASRQALRRERLDTVLLHRADHLDAWDGAVWALLRDEARAGGIATLGVSAQTPAELLRALDCTGVAHVQLPFNVLDWRWRTPEIQERLAARGGLTIHVRSALLQGVLAADDARVWPVLPALDARAFVYALGAMAETLGRESVADLCLAYVRGQSFVDGVVVGAENEAQLERNVALFARPPLDPDEAMFAERFFPRVPEALLNPALWPKESEPETIPHARLRAV